MNKEDISKVLSADIDFFRSRAEYYESHHLYEAASMADKLAANLELALTTLPAGTTTGIT